MRSSSYSEPQFAKATRGSRRELAIDSFSQTPTSSVWYYRVNVSVYDQVLVSTFIDEDSSDDEADRSSGDSLVTTDIEHYSIRRRYSDFLHLYEQICAELGSDTNTLPPFPGKEVISPVLKGMLRRESSSTNVLTDRSTKFAALLQWIESHPTARDSPAFVKFIGKPPQSRDGYVSLKEYAPSDWLSSLQQTAKGVESRRRRSSTAGRLQLERSSSETINSLSSFHRQQIESMRGVTSISGSTNDMEARYSMP